MQRLMFYPMVVGMLNLLFISYAHACLNDQALMQIKTNEEALLISRNVAPMTDALHDQLLSVQVKQMDDTCKVTVTYTLPEQDIAEANQLLDTNPAKRIMLAGQGYTLPTQTTLIAEANIDANTLAIDHKDILQSAPLGKNRASVELLYATLAQTRAVINPESKNTALWPTSLINEELTTCEAKYSSNASPEACSCRVNALSQTISPRQLSYINYLANDPYASATGALSTYYALSEQVNFSCKLTKR